MTTVAWSNGKIEIFSTKSGDFVKLMPPCKMIKHLILILLITLTSCKKKTEISDAATAKHITKEVKKTQKINCFQKKDSLEVLNVLNMLKQSCAKKENKHNLFTKNFKKFPCELFHTALNNDAIPDFEIEDQSAECHTLAVYYNYIIKITDDNEEHSSESTFILYLIKNTNGEIFLEGIGAAG